MKMVVQFIDNEIFFDDESVNAIEIENKNYFYRLIKNLICISNDEVIEEVNFYNENFSETNMNGKIEIIIDYFNINFNNKKNIVNLNKYITNSVTEEDILKLNNNYRKIITCFKKIANDIGINISVEETYDFSNVIKLMGLKIIENDTLLDNLFLLLDVFKLLYDNKLIVFVNLKQYLASIELVELYKYAIFNNIHIMLIDSQSYGVKLQYEKKLIIDTELNEFML